MNESSSCGFNKEPTPPAIITLSAWDSYFFPGPLDVLGGGVDALPKAA